MEKLIEKINLAITANGGEDHRADWCQCDPSVGLAPGAYCAIWIALSAVKHYLEKDISHPVNSADAK